MSETGEEKHDFKTIRRHIARGAVWMVSMRWAVRLIGLLNTVILARLLTPEDFGVVAMAMVVVGFLHTVADLNVDQALLRDQHVSRAHYDTAWTLQIIAGHATTAFLFALTPLVAAYYGDDRVSLVMYIIALRPAILAWENIGQVEFRRSLNFSKEFWYWIYRRASLFIFAIILVLIIRNYFALALAAPLSGILAVAISYRMSSYRPRFALSKWREIWSFSKWLMLLMPGRFLGNRGDEFVVGGVAGATMMGHYYVAADIATMPTRELVMPVGRALLPTFAKISHDPNELRMAFRMVTGFLAVVCFSVGGGLALVADDLVHVVLGGQWLDSVPFFRWLAIYGAIAGMVIGLQPYSFVRHRERQYALAHVYYVVLMLPSLFLVGHMFDLVSIAMTRTAFTGLLLGFILAQVVYYDGIGWSEVASTIWRPLVASACMSLGVIQMRLETSSPFLNLMHDSAVGAILFTTFLIGLWVLSGRPYGIEKMVLGYCMGQLRRLRGTAA